MSMTFNEAKSYAQQMARPFQALVKLEEVLLAATQADQATVQLKAEVQALQTRLAEDEAIHGNLIEEQAVQLGKAEAETHRAEINLVQVRAELAEARTAGKAEADQVVEAEQRRASAEKQKHAEFMRGAEMERAELEAKLAELRDELEALRLRWRL